MGIQGQSNDSNLSIFLEELKLVQEQFIKSIRATQQLLIILNAGAVITLVGFFTNGSVIANSSIRVASILFIIGAILGVCTLVGDFFSGYFLFKNLMKISVEKELMDEYCSDGRKRVEKLQNVIFWLVTLGTTSIVSWYLGVCVVVTYILKENCYQLIAAVLFFLFILVFGFLFISWMKSKLEWKFNKDDKK